METGHVLRAESAALGIPTGLLSPLFLSRGVGAAGPVRGIGRPSREAGRGSVLPGSEARSAPVLALQINKEKMDGFLNSKWGFSQVSSVGILTKQELELHVTGTVSQAQWDISKHSPRRYFHLCKRRDHRFSVPQAFLERWLSQNNVVWLQVLQEATAWLVTRCF